MPEPSREAAHEGAKDTSGGLLSKEMQPTGSFPGPFLLFEINDSGDRLSSVNQRAFRRHLSEQFVSVHTLGIPGKSDRDSGTMPNAKTR